MVRHPVLTARERGLIAFALVSVTVGIRFGLMAAAGESMGDLRQLAATCITSLVLLPWGLTIVERFHDCRSSGCRWRTGVWIACYGCLCGILSAALWVSMVLLDGESPSRRIAPRFAQQLAVWNLVLLFIGGGVGRAMHGYRAAVLEGERRHELDMAEATRSRQAIERRTRPETVIATLETIAGQTVADAARARLLLLRLARHQRMLLTRPSSPSSEDELHIVRSSVALFRADVRLEIGRCQAFPDFDVAEPWLRSLESTLIEGPPGRYLVECDRQEHSVVLRLRSLGDGQERESEGISVELPLTKPRANRRQPETGGEFSPSFGSSTFTAALVVYLMSAILSNLGDLDRQVDWSDTVMTLASAVQWLVVGPVVYRITAICARLRLPVALLLSTASALLGAAVVTVASLGFLRLVTGGDQFALDLPLMASRNANAAFVVCASSFAASFSRMLIAARAEAMRAEHGTVRAEARELEARFQPHFLFNTLASIAGLIRLNPGAAEEMCRLLARLVARTRAYTGIPSWTVKDEVTFVADYLAIQRRRFADRLRIANWDVGPSTMDVAIPRLSLQPLIENIFIHAVAASYEPISIGLSIGRRGRALTVEIWNDMADGQPMPGHGRGLAFVSNRARDAGGSMLIVSSVDRFTVHLTIPIRKPSRYRMNAPIPPGRVAAAS